MKETSEQFKPEKKSFEKIKTKLQIREPEFDKNFMVAFEGKTEKKCKAYNWAICDVLNEARLNPFHQIGTSPDGQNEPGYHAWEVWRDITREQLESLLPKIEEKAREYFKDLG